MVYSYIACMSHTHTHRVHIYTWYIMYILCESVNQSADNLPGRFNLFASFHGWSTWIIFPSLCAYILFPFYQSTNNAPFSTYPFHLSFEPVGYVLDFPSFKNPARQARSGQVRNRDACTTVRVRLWASLVAIPSNQITLTFAPRHRL